MVITTIQRLFSMLRGDDDFDPALEDLSSFEARDVAEPVVAYSAGLPPEYFDIVFIDECHRSIYTLWRQVLEYFDAYLIGLTATPAKHTFGFFNQNLVMEYTREQAVADRVNVDYDIYKIRTRITEQGGRIEAAEGVVLPRAQALVKSFEQYVAENKDEIEALQFFYAQPWKRRLKYEDIRALANAIGTPPRNWTPERLWQAYAQLDGSRVRGASSERLLTDIVSLVRFALHQQPELTPYAEQIHARFTNWLDQQHTAGRTFTDEQLRWLTMMRDHVVQSLEVEISDFDLTPFVEQGGLGRVAQVFGKSLAAIVSEVNEVLAA